MADEIARTFEEVMSGFEQTSGQIGQQLQQTAVTPPVSPGVTAPGGETSGDIPHPAQVGASAAAGESTHAAAPTSVPPPDPTALKQQADQQVSQMVATPPVVASGTTPAPPTPKVAQPEPVAPPGLAEMQHTQQQITAGQMQSAPAMQAMSTPGQTNLPDPSLLTPPGMGAFRQTQVSPGRPQMPLGITGQPPPTGLIPGVGDRITPERQFQRPFDSAIAQASDRAALAGQRYSAFAQSSGRAIAGAFGGTVGGVLGGIAGTALGGPSVGASFAEYGGMAGALAGSFAPGVGRMTAAMFRPSIERRYDTIRMRQASQDFFTAGPTSQTDITGSGLSPQAAEDLTRDFDRIAGGREGRTREDITNIAQMSGEVGLLDMAGDKEEIADTVKNITDLVGAFAKVTGTPDFKENIRQIAQMRQMGVPLQDMNEAARNMDMFARQAGMNTGQLMNRHGQQGASIFRRAGLTPGGGIETAGYGQAMAQTGVNAGAFNVQQLGMYGGTSGIGQMVTESQAAFTQGPLSKVLPALLNRTEDGFEVDQSTIQSMQSGDASFQDLVQQGTAGMGTRDMMQIQMRSDELASRVQQELGPRGTNLAMMNMIENMSESMGTSTRAAAHSVFKRNPQRANAITEMMNDPNTMYRMRRMEAFEQNRRQYAEFQSGGQGPITEDRAQQMNPEEGMLTDWFRSDMQSKRLGAVGAARNRLGAGTTLGLSDKARDVIDMSKVEVPTGGSPEYTAMDVMTGPRGTIRREMGQTSYLEDAFTMPFGAISQSELDRETARAEQMMSGIVGSQDVGRDEGFGRLRETFGDTGATEVVQAARQATDVSMGSGVYTPPESTIGGERVNAGTEGEFLIESAVTTGSRFVGLTEGSPEEIVRQISKETGESEKEILKNFESIVANMGGARAKHLKQLVPTQARARLLAQRKDVDTEELEREFKGVFGFGPDDVSGVSATALDMLMQHPTEKGKKALLGRAIRGGEGSSVLEGARERLKKEGDLQEVLDAAENYEGDIAPMGTELAESFVRPVLGQTMGDNQPASLLGRPVKGETVPGIMSTGILPNELRREDGEPMSGLPTAMEGLNAVMRKTGSMEMARIREQELWGLPGEALFDEGETMTASKAGERLTRRLMRGGSKKLFSSVASDVVGAGFSAANLKGLVQKGDAAELRRIITTSLTREEAPGSEVLDGLDLERVRNLEGDFSTGDGGAEGSNKHIQANNVILKMDNIKFWGRNKGRAP